MRPDNDWLSVSGQKTLTAGLSLGSFCCLAKSLCCWIALLTGLLGWQAFFSALVDVVIQTFFYRHPHLLLAALPLSPFQLLDRAQNALCLGPDLVGALSLLPVALLYLARPLAVRPAPFFTESFSPLPTDSLTFFLGNCCSLIQLGNCQSTGVLKVRRLLKCLPASSPLKTA